MTQNTGSLAVASMMDAIIKKEADYSTAVKDNYNRSKLTADRIMQGGALEQALLKLAKEENPVISQEYVLKFLEEQRGRLKDLACQNIANQRTVHSFVEAAKDIREKEMSRTQTQAQEGNDFLDYEQLIKENMEKDRASKKASELAVEHEKFYRDIVERLGEKTAAQAKNEEDEDIMLLNDGSGQAYNLKCPITMTLLENPVINMICKHHYSRAAIESYVDSKLRNRQRVRCPVAGCTNGHVTIEQLEDDSEIALLIRRFKRQEVKQSQQFASQAENLADSDDE